MTLFRSRHSLQEGCRAQQAPGNRQDQPADYGRDGSVDPDAPRMKGERNGRRHEFADDRPGQADDGVRERAATAAAREHAAEPADEPTACECDEYRTWVHG